MIKWLVISLVVFLGFFIVLLGLGYLLQENEKSVTVLKSQLDQQRSLQEKKQQKQAKIQSTLSAHSSDLIVEYQQSSVELIEKKADEDVNSALVIISKNLTCVSVEQCVLVKTTLVNESCFVAINTIGAAKLAKLEDSENQENFCPEVIEKPLLSCQKNLCITTLN